MVRFRGTLTPGRLFTCSGALRSVFCGVVSWLLLAAACAQPVPVTTAEPVPEPRAAATPTLRPRAARATAADASVPWAGQTRWPVKLSEHVDLWLHAFAMVSEDTARVPLFRRGYRDSVTVVKNRLAILTSLDVNRATLARQLASSPGYQQAQFLAFEYASWDAMRSSAERYLQLTADSRLPRDRDASTAGFAAVFPSTTDREWLRLFVVGVEAERRQFFGTEYPRVMRSRSAVVTAVDSLWQVVYRPRFDRFLNNSGQSHGDVLLSIPVGGAGRSGSGRERQSAIAVPFPDRVSDATNVIVVLAHELTGRIAALVVRDNTTVAERRSGAADRLLMAAQVRAGAMLVERVAPELSNTYRRYYLLYATVMATDGDLAASFARNFDLPAAVQTDMQRQIDLALSGN